MSHGPQVNPLPTTLDVSLPLMLQEPSSIRWIREDDRAAGRLELRQEVASLEQWLDLNA